MTLIPPAFYPRKVRRWRRIHTSLVIATLLNFVFLLTVGALAGRAVQDPIYEVNLAERIRNDAADVAAPRPKKKMVLAPAPAQKLTLDPRKAGGGAPAPAPAPGNRPDQPLAKAPPPLKINAPKVTEDPDPIAENQPSVVTGRPLPHDASDQGNPEGVTGGTGPQNSEGPGGKGTGGTGPGGTGPGGNGTGEGGRFAQLVNRVVCLGCHQNAVQGCDMPPRPFEIEKLFTSVRWKFGGQEHPLTLGCTINEQGYITQAVVVQSSGNSDVDNSAIQLLQMSKWYPARRGGGAVEIYVEVPLKVYF